MKCTYTCGPGARAWLRMAAMRCLCLPVLAALLARKRRTVGGQAIIEGVMMRARDRVAWAVRRPDARIAVEQLPYLSLQKRYKPFSWVLVRGFISLIESLYLGYKALNRSAELAYETDGGKKPSKAADTLAAAGTFIFALGVSIAVFMYLPMWALSRGGLEKSSLTFNVLAGALRICLFLLYLALISLWKEMRRIFEYHGAEHKTVFAFEENLPLTIESVRPFSTLHPRCGTSFLILVGMVCILLFSVIDAVVIRFIGPYPNALYRMAVHLMLVPLVSGVSYEALKLSDRYKRIPPVGLLIKPGLWFQKITTREPDNAQIETAIAALKAAVAL
jgi:uncharacterized protein YqhQ